MSILPIRRYRNHVEPLDRFFGDQLDLFDPWNDFDLHPTTFSNQYHNFRWINRPQRSLNSQLVQSSASNREMSQLTDEKFRIEFDVAGFNSDTVKTHVEGHKIIIEAKQEEKNSDGDLIVKQIRKTYELPKYSDFAQLVSYITPNNMLVVEVPIQKPKVEKQLIQSEDQQKTLAQFGQHRDSDFDYVHFLNGSDFKPKVVDKENNQKQLEMALEMKNYKPDEIKVSVKNNQLIVQGEHKQKDNNHSGRSYFYKSILLPPGIQYDHLQSYLTENGLLKIEAPFVEQTKTTGKEQK